jgi:hypothetical protein
MGSETRGTPAVNSLQHIRFLPRSVIRLSDLLGPSGFPHPRGRALIHRSVPRNQQAAFSKLSPPVSKKSGEHSQHNLAGSTARYVL